MIRTYPSRGKRSALPANQYIYGRHGSWHTYERWTNKSLIPVREVPGNYFSTPPLKVTCGTSRSLAMWNCSLREAMVTKLTTRPGDGGGVVAGLVLGHGGEVKQNKVHDEVLPLFIYSSALLRIRRRHGICNKVIK